MHKYGVENCIKKKQNKTKPKQKKPLHIVS